MFQIWEKYHLFSEYFLIFVFCLHSPHPTGPLYITCSTILSLWMDKLYLYYLFKVRYGDIRRNDIKMDFLIILTFGLLYYPTFDLPNTVELIILTFYL